MNILRMPILALIALLCTCGHAQNEVEPGLSMVAEFTIPCIAFTEFHVKETEVEFSVLYMEVLRRIDKQYVAE